MTMTQEKKVKATTVALPKDLREKVEADAAKDRRSVSSTCVRIIEKHYARQQKPQSA